MINESGHSNNGQHDLCRYLHWKGQFIAADPIAPVVPAEDSVFWCAFTQTCLGPDGELTEPKGCSSLKRPCYGTGHLYNL